MKQLKRILVVAAIGIAICNGLFAQQKPPECNGRNDHAYPRMFVFKKEADERKAEFAMIPNSKYDAILKVNYSQDLKLIYSAKAFNNLLSIINKDSGIRIYFAKYTSGDIELPVNVVDNRLILLFAKEDYSENAPTMYYFLNNKKNDTEPYPVKPDIAEKWIKDYNQLVQVELRKTIDSLKIDQNRDPKDQAGVYNDTKSIFISKSRIEEAFNTEVQYQRNEFNVQVDAYMVSFSAYTSKGNDVEKFKNRLTLQFDYLDKDGKVIYLDQQPWCQCRTYVTSKQTKQEEEKVKRSLKAAGKSLKNWRTSPKAINTLNKGLLCPTNCPPRPS